MTDAIKRAAEAAYPTPEGIEPTARAMRHVLREGYERGWRESREAALSDREGMARVLAKDDDLPWSALAPGRQGYWRRQVDALVAHLLGGEA